MTIIHPEENLFTFTNDGNLWLCFVGVGSAFARKNYQTNLLVVKGQDHLLMDTGTKCSLALHEMGFSVTDIKNLYISHSHADHIGGLEEFALFARYIVRTKAKMYITEEYQRLLWEESLQGGCRYSEKNGGKYLSFEDFFEPVRPAKLKGYPRDTYEFQVGSINVKIMRTRHIPEDAEGWKDAAWSTGAIFDDRVFFSGDTQFDKDLIVDYDQKFNFEAIFHDVQFFKGGVHASLDELNTLPPEIKKKTYLVHYGDNWLQFESKIKEYGFAGFVESQVYYSF